MDSIRVVRGGDLVAGKDRDGISRRSGQAEEEVSLAMATLEAGRMSGWHHHGDHTSCVYVLQGRLHIDWGAGGRECVDLAAGDFYVVPPHLVHREGNSGADELRLAAFYLGTGPLSTDAESPELESDLVPGGS